MLAVRVSARSPQPTAVAAGAALGAWLFLAARARALCEDLTSVQSWPDAVQTVAPLGWRAASDPNYQVPTYAVGLPMLMAPLHAAGGLIAALLIVPVSFALAVWATGVLALRIAGPLAAILAALWLATSPVALIEAMQPMSDVPVTAAWLMCWLILLRREAGTDLLMRAWRLRDREPFMRDEKVVTEAEIALSTHGS